MAASADYLSRLSACFVVILCALNSCMCQNVTGTTANATNTTVASVTVNVTAADNTTTNLTTTVAPTTTTVTTTTTSTLAPTVPGTNIPPNSEISKCPCDLTGQACDVNCCCDPDCTDEDKRVFSECYSNSYRLDGNLCFERNVFLFENGPTFSNTTDDMFCIYFDNEEERNYYINPSLITTEAQFTKYVEEYGEFSFQAPPLNTPTAEFANFYKSGDPMYVVFPSQAFSYLSLPTALSTAPACIDGNPAAYLLDQSNECLRSVSNLQNDCQNTAAFQALTFYQDLAVVRDPFLLHAFNSSLTVVDPVLGTVDLSSVTDLYDNDYTIKFELDTNSPLQCEDSSGVVGTCNFTSPPSVPTWNAGSNTCENVLTRVHFRFVTQGTFGVQNAYVSFVFSDVTSTQVTQTFLTSFTTTTASADSFKRSGRPGYDVGQPIIAGILNETIVGGNKQQKILLLKDRGQQLGLVKPSITGGCLTQAGQPREPVSFGQDMRSGCFIQVSLNNTVDNCQLLQNSIIVALEGYAVPTFTDGIYPKNYRYVSMFGDSDTYRTGDWLEILYKSRPLPPTASSTTCFLSLGMNIQIIYANVGSLPNPQPKIIGVSFVYDHLQDVSYKCSAPLCQPTGGSQLSQKIEISSTVTFIDASQPPEHMEGVYPTFAGRLPYDFFYPFLNSSSMSNIGNWCLVLVLSALISLKLHHDHS